ncbi:putative acyltransferase [Singulisphaera acidiphila DSM 18658]|uniref:Putative acyltransferase n=2 Tax=Singulisphaera acidiphila TaxID=466153 RepID=L0D7J6_SINAD|nr:putative acyltransferase [Singulisphaera acidiphila DSM 18658]
MTKMITDPRSDYLPAPVAAISQSRSFPRLNVNEKIDVCRGLFAVLVVIAHSWELTWALHPTALLALSPLLRQFIGCTVGSGICWVMGFFVISGYCIHLSIERLMKAGEFPVRQYFIARFTRIFPLYYLALLFTIIVEGSIGSARPSIWPNGRSPLVVLAQVFAIQGVSQTFGSFAPSWSITNEIFYYIVYGFLAYYAKRQSSRPLRLGILLSLVITLACQAYYFGFHKSLVVLNIGLLFGLGLNWFFGAWVAAHREAMVQSVSLRILTRVWPLFLVAAITLRFYERIPQLAYLLSGFSFTLMLIHFLKAEEPEQSTQESPWLAKRTEEFGLSSYPMYLFHGPIILLVGALLPRLGLLIDWRLTWAIASISGILVGLVLGIVVERPIMAWRAGFLRRLRTR